MDLFQQDCWCFEVAGGSSWWTLVKLMDPFDWVLRIDWHICGDVYGFVGSIGLVYLYFTTWMLEFLWPWPWCFWLFFKTPLGQSPKWPEVLDCDIRQKIDLESPEVVGRLPRCWCFKNPKQPPFFSKRQQRCAVRRKTKMFLLRLFVFVSFLGLLCQ